MNPSSQVFQHQIEVVHSLKKYFNYVDVVSSDSRPEWVSANDRISIHSLNWQIGRPIRNILNLYQVSIKLLLSNKPDTVLFHMTDVQSALLAPIFRICGITTTLWYAHAKRSIWLLLAYPWTTSLVTSTPESLRIRSKKVHCIGQAINMQLFKFSQKQLDTNDLNLVHVGRIDPAKKINEMMEWANSSKFRSRFRKFVFFGAPSSTSLNYMDTLLNAYRMKVDEGFFEFPGKINRVDLPSVLSQFSIFIHLFQGSLDKSLLEATSLGIPVITLNKAFISEFGRWGSHDELSLDSEMEALLSLSQEDRKDEIRRRYELIESRHSIHNWSDKIFTYLC